ncbi:MAG TPA: hypothetical protein VGJ96_03260 [Gemmatimonadaceae bacterium]|jgi:hypothetical protein
MLPVAACRAPSSWSCTAARRAGIVIATVLLVADAASAQRPMTPGGGMRPEPPRGDRVEPMPLPPIVGDTTTPEGAARAAQRRFELLRRNNLPNAHSVRPGNCDEQVGRWCYWYDEKAPKSIELPIVTLARDTLLRRLDSLGHLVPSNRWIAGQRVRYFAEAGRDDEALASARQCRADGWWCAALVAFSQHLRGDYAAADSGFRVVQSMMGERERCNWRDISLLIDDDTRQPYRRMPCGPEREAFEDRVWFFSRTLYGLRGNDSRSEWNARQLMVRLYQDAPGAHQFGFDDDERELLLRFGWPRYWAKGPGDPRAGGFSIVSDEASPAYRYIPAGNVLSNPALSDSAQWRLHLPPVIGRYAPPYARRLVPLEHQQAMFRRGDSALLVMSYDVSGVPALAGASHRRAAMTVTPGDQPAPRGTARARAAVADTMSVRAAWGPLLFSGEVWAPDSAIVARARYGVHPPYAVDTRVTVSDLLFYRPAGAPPTSVEEALALALPTERVRSSAPLGVYWETYGTDVQGEQIKLTVTVVREVEEGGFLRRKNQQLRLVRQATPVSVTVNDMTARGRTTSPRAVQLDISTLKKGAYIVQLEIEVNGQYPLRADHRIEIIDQ